MYSTINRLRNWFIFECSLRRNTRAEICSSTAMCFTVFHVFQPCVSHNHRITQRSNRESFTEHQELTVKPWTADMERSWMLVQWISGEMGLWCRVRLYYHCIPSLSASHTHTDTHCELRCSLRCVISASRVSCFSRCLVSEESEESLVSLLNSHESLGAAGSCWGHGPPAYRKDTFYGHILKSPVETSVRARGRWSLWVLGLQRCWFH